MAAFERDVGELWSVLAHSTAIKDHVAHAAAFVSTACIVASTEGEDIYSVHLSIIVSMSQGIL